MTFSSSRHIKLEVLRQTSVGEDACSVCFDRAADTVLRPCGHRGLCKDCASQLEHCPMCRAAIKETEKEEEEEGKVPGKENGRPK